METIEEYLDSLRAAGRSAETCKQYRWQLLRWRAWCANAGVTRLEDLTKAALRRWAASLRDHWQPATCRVAVISIKGYLRWCSEEGTAPAELAEALKTPKRPRRQQRTITTAEFAALLAACGTDPVGLRNRALLLLAFDSLLRAGELCRLDVNDIDLQRRAVLVLGKGDRQEIVRFGAETSDALQAWLAVRPGPSPGPLFVALGGLHPSRRLTRDGLRAILRKLALRAAVPPCSPHALRRGGAVALIEGGAPSRFVQMHARWDDLSMLELYTQRLDASAMYDRFSAVDRLTDSPQNQTVKPSVYESTRAKP